MKSSAQVRFSTGGAVSGCRNRRGRFRRSAFDGATVVVCPAFSVRVAAHGPVRNAPLATGCEGSRVQASKEDSADAANRSGAIW